MEMSKKFGRIQRNFSSISKHRRNDHAHQFGTGIGYPYGSCNTGKNRKKTFGTMSGAGTFAGFIM